MEKKGVTAAAAGLRPAPFEWRACFTGCHIHHSRPATTAMVISSCVAKMSFQLPVVSLREKTVRFSSMIS